jgi:hypothetical protein
MCVSYACVLYWRVCMRICMHAVPAIVRVHIYMFLCVCALCVYVCVVQKFDAICMQCLLSYVYICTCFFCVCFVCVCVSVVQKFDSICMPAIVICFEKYKTYTHTYTHTPMVTAQIVRSNFHVLVVRVCVVYVCVCVFVVYVCVCLLCVCVCVYMCVCVCACCVCVSDHAL